MAEYSAADARRVVDEVRRQKKLASEYAGNAGQAGKNFLETTGLKASVLSLAVRLDGFEVERRTEFLRELVRLCDNLGHFDQIDAFDDLGGILRGIGEKIGGQQAEPETGSGEPAGDEAAAKPRSRRRGPKDSTLDELENAA